MKTVRECAKLLHAQVLSGEDLLERDVDGVFIGDLLSWVMAKGKGDQLWVSVQSHLNVIAVASLKEFSAVILAQSAEVSKESVQKAQEENVILLSTDLSAYEIACVLHDAGV